MPAEDVYVTRKESHGPGRKGYARPARTLRLLFFSHKPPRATEAEIEAIRARAKKVHAIIGNKQMDVVDLFALIGEDEIAPRKLNTPGT